MKLVYNLYVYIYTLMSKLWSQTYFSSKTEELFTALHETSQRCTLQWEEQYIDIKMWKRFEL